MSRLELIDALFQDHARTCILCGSNGPAVCKRGLAILDQYQQELAGVPETADREKAA